MLSAATDVDRLLNVAGPVDTTYVGTTTPSPPSSVNDLNNIGPSNTVESSSHRTHQRVSDELQFVQLNLQHCKAGTTVWYSRV